MPIARVIVEIVLLSSDGVSILGPCRSQGDSIDMHCVPSSICSIRGNVWCLSLQCSESRLKIGSVIRCLRYFVFTGRWRRSRNWSHAVNLRMAFAIELESPILVDLKHLSNDILFLAGTIVLYLLANTGGKRHGTCFLRHLRMKLRPSQVF